MTKDELKALVSETGVSEDIIEKALKIVDVLHPPIESNDNRGTKVDYRRDNGLLAVAFVVLSDVQYHKEGSYGNSWERRKEIGVFMNLARKFDRIESIMIDGGKDEVGETTLDTIGDLTNYGMLWLTYFLRKKPEDFKAWVKSSLGEKVDEKETKH